MDALTSKTALAAAGQTDIDRPTREQAEEAVRTLIAWAGDDPRREGLQGMVPRLRARSGQGAGPGVRGRAGL
jgi:GTP cyclohydrolase I